MTQGTLPEQIELLPCPFCGGKAESYFGGRDALVRCEECPADMGVFETEAETIAAWNRRTPTHSAPDLERVARAIREEQVRQIRDNESYTCPAGESYFEEHIGPYQLAKAAIEAMIDIG